MAISEKEKVIPIPGPSALPVFGNLFDLDLEHGLESILQLAKEYGPIFELTIAGKKQLFISSRDLMNELCDETRFCKIVTGGVEQLRDGVGDALFTAHDGEENWGIAHRIIMPVFGPIKIRSMFDTMKEVAIELCSKWVRYGSQHPFEASDDFTRLTLDTIALCAMDFRFNSFYRDENMHPFVGSMTGFLQEADKRSTVPDFVNHLRRKASKSYKHDIASMKAISQSIIDQRREYPVDKPDLLNALLIGRDTKTGKGLSDDAIINNLITFLIAGHETTSGLLSFALHYLLKHPTTYLAAQIEVDSVVGRDSLTLEHLTKLPYITAVLKEALRLMPTAPAFSVTPREDCIVGEKYFVKKGVPMTLLLANIHRDPSVWGEDAETWKPERMLDENFNESKPNTWKPFGNGARGCIGRAFAWQEAQLVIAILLQTFTITSEDPKYELRIKESLTIKPDGLKVRATLRQQGFPAGMSKKSPCPSCMTESFTPRDHGSFEDSEISPGKPMTILYGSNSGTCEALAHRLAGHTRMYGFSKPTIVSLDSATGSLPKNQPVIIITASYDGEPTDNARKFLAWLKTVESKSLENVTYAVFGCGNRDWKATFHKIPLLIDSLMAGAGAERLATLGTADAGRSDIFSDFEAWEEDILWPEILKNFNPGHSLVPSASDFQVSVSHPRPITLHHKVAEAIVTRTETLTKGGPVKKNIEFRLPAGMTYKTGDYLSILPLNPHKSVQRALAAFRLAKDSVLELNASSNSTSLPLMTPVSASDLFGSYVELTQQATPGNIRMLIAAASEEPTKQALLALSDPLISSGVRVKCPSVLDILEKFKDIKLSVGSFLEMLPPLRIRTYSISSAPEWKPLHASLTISVINEPSRSGSGQFLGVASNYLSELCEGDVVHVMTRDSKSLFHPPTDPNEFPIIMIAAGSGLAPFLGFLQQRLLQLRGGLKLQPALLFFGCRSPESDDIHRSTLNEFEQAGVVTIYRVYSASSSGPRYVQDKLSDHTHIVKEFWTNGAKVFVCGSTNMVDGVKTMFAGLLVEGKDDQRGEIPKFVHLDSSLDPSRFVVEVFG